MIYDVGDTTIDFSKVVKVGKVFGDKEHRRYSVCFLGGWRSEIYLHELGRDEFINLWVESKKNKTIMRTLNEEARIVQNSMQKWGGGFVKILGKALYLADPDNTRRIKEGFPDYWEKYLEMGEGEFKH